jgi:hypothetical protein
VFVYSASFQALLEPLFFFFLMGFVFCDSYYPTDRGASKGGHCPDLCFFFFMGFVFCDSYYPTNRGGLARVTGANREGPARAREGRTGGEGQGGPAQARGGHGRERIKQGGGHGQGRIERSERHGRRRTERGKLDGCIMHQVHTSEF